MSARDTMVGAVRRELFGPLPEAAPVGKPLDLASAPRFATWEEARGPWHDMATGEEVLSESGPNQRYGVGILFPRGARPEETRGVVGLPTDADERDQPEAPIIDSRSAEADGDDFDLSDANTFQPSAMGITSRIKVGNTDGQIRVTVNYSTYERVIVQISSTERTWWVRRPATLVGTITLEQLRQPSARLFALTTERESGVAARTPEIRVYSRPQIGTDDSERLVTICMVNTSDRSGPSETLFQCRLQAECTGGLEFLPYTEPLIDTNEQEAASLALLYRRSQTYGIGHGCAATWLTDPSGRAIRLQAEVLPTHEVPSLTPDLFVEAADGTRTPLRVDMAELASGSPEGKRQVEQVIELYGEWINSKRHEATELPPPHRSAASRHIAECQAALERIRYGWELVQDEPIAARAFALANEAMYHQQQRSRLPLRDVKTDRHGLLVIQESQPSVSLGPGVSYWRPFQVCFLLSCLPEVIFPGADDRETVDLIFFPTGGGKTEAYLAVAALSAIGRRLRDSEDAGTDTLMRYTLRLLTAQQFVRAASLFLVLEDIRSRADDLGSRPFSIGIWLGGSTTPNSWKQATTALRTLQRDARASNPFLILKCPWCGCRMGPIASGSQRVLVIGYLPSGKRVLFRCPDNRCRFGGDAWLPIHVVDEDIYATSPTLVIGTVDKFAMLAWRPEARSLFGLGDDGKRTTSPPSLVIQDELHLISGPLGSLCGLYEPVIERLSTDHRYDPPVKPKIICSTATIRQFSRQIMDLYGRRQAKLFPPHGLEEGRSFFAEPATEVDGGPAPGRLYMGILAPALGSMQSLQVRVFASTLQGAVDLDEEERDPYWTNLVFLNSLRELGNTVSLLQSDVPDYLTAIRRRDALGERVRWPRRVMELTSRRRSDEIPKAIEELEQEVGSNEVFDLCLASNIIEVGVDINRLGLMTIVGQPKTTAQYIQVSGRVGRQWQTRPGLILTLYGAAKPRDRSHYERFATYHQSLYAQVEPTSLTPFALPVLNRGVHGALVAGIRQSQDEDLDVYPFPADAFETSAEILRERLRLVDPDELSALEQVLRRRRHEWDAWERTAWSANEFDGDPSQGLMRFAGTALGLGGKAPVWEVPSSMRSVDAECELRVTTHYASERAESEAGIET